MYPIFDEIFLEIAGETDPDIFFEKVYSFFESKDQKFDLSTLNSFNDILRFGDYMNSFSMSEENFIPKIIFGMFESKYKIYVGYPITKKRKTEISRDINAFRFAMKNEGRYDRFLMGNLYEEEEYWVRCMRRYKYLYDRELAINFLDVNADTFYLESEIQIFLKSDRRRNLKVNEVRHPDPITEDSSKKGGGTDRAVEENGQRKLIGLLESENIEDFALACGIIEGYSNHGVEILEPVWEAFQKAVKKVKEPEWLGMPTFALKYVETIDFWNKRLSEIPKGVFSCKNLKILSLMNIQLQSLPREIWNLKSLVRLGLWNTKIQFLPSEIGKLENLEYLSMGENQLTYLPVVIGNLKNLEQLNLSKNQLVSLPDEIGNLKNLKELDLSNNQLTSIPPEIGKLENLQKLDLSKNRLTSIPLEVGKLENLERLNLSNNQLTSIPPEIGYLENLEKLDLRGNQLTSLPDSIRQLGESKRLLTDIDLEEL